jgi:hypothetical protein
MDDVQEVTDAIYFCAFEQRRRDDVIAGHHVAALRSI